MMLLEYVFSFWYCSEEYYSVIFTFCLTQVLRQSVLQNIKRKCIWHTIKSKILVGSSDPAKWIGHKYETRYAYLFMVLLCYLQELIGSLKSLGSDITIETSKKFAIKTKTLKYGAEKYVSKILLHSKWNGIKHFSFSNCTSSAQTISPI